MILPIYDILGDYPEIRHVLVRHEQGGAHAADGYARATGKVGVCMGTSGPGATNLVTGIATAQLDSIPMVAITGNVPSALIGKDAFQEIDITGITLPMTKHNYLVRDANDIPRVVAEAFHLARTGRPGPVHVDITKDALQQETTAEHPTATTSSPGCRASAPRSRATPSSSSSPPARSPQAKRPLILAGHGVLIADAMDELKAFAEKTQIPVAWTLLGIGALDETHPLAYGYMGMHGWKHVNRAIQSADLLIAIGMRFDDRVTGSVRTYAPYARIIHATSTRPRSARTSRSRCRSSATRSTSSRASPAVVHESTRPRARTTSPSSPTGGRLRGQLVARLGRLADGLLSADYVVERIGELTNHDRDLRRRRRPEPDVARALHELPPAEQPRQLGRPGHDGLRGPGGDGRGARQPRRETWAIAGDGGFQMTCQELMTLAADRSR